MQIYLDSEQRSHLHLEGEQHFQIEHVKGPVNLNLSKFSVREAHRLVDEVIRT
jgi:hypothetical protein